MQLSVVCMQQLPTNIVRPFPETSPMKFHIRLPLKCRFKFVTFIYSVATGGYIFLCVSLFDFLKNIHSLSPRCLWFKHLNHELSQDLSEDSLETRGQWAENPSQGWVRGRFRDIHHYFPKHRYPWPAWETVRVVSWLKEQLCSLFQPQTSVFLQDRYWKEEAETKLKDVSIWNHTPESDLSKREHHLQQLNPGEVIRYGCVLTCTCLNIRWIQERI